MSSVIRGSDNFDSLAHQGIGVNQTWQNVKGSRAVGVIYTNSTGNPIQILITSTKASGGKSTFKINGSIVRNISITSSYHTGTLDAIIPDGATYELGTGVVTSWWELR